MAGLTEDEAIRMTESGWWVGRLVSDVAEFQLNEERQCMPWPIYRYALEQALGRPVYISEFTSAGKAQLLNELAARRRGV